MIGSLRQLYAYFAANYHRQMMMMTAVAAVLVDNNRTYYPLLWTMLLPYFEYELALVSNSTYTLAAVNSTSSDTTGILCEILFAKASTVDFDCLISKVLTIVLNSIWSLVNCLKNYLQCLKRAAVSVVQYRPEFLIIYSLAHWVWLDPSNCIFHLATIAINSHQLSERKTEIRSTLVVCVWKIVSISSFTC